MNNQNLIRSGGNTYISSCSSEFSSANHTNITSKNTVNMEYSVSTHSLTVESSSLNNSTYLRENFQKSINGFMNIPEESGNSDGDEDSLIVLTDLNNSNIISQSNPAFDDNNNLVTQIQQDMLIKEDSFQSDLEERVETAFTEENGQIFWRPIEKVVESEEIISEKVFDLLADSFLQPIALQGRSCEPSVDERKDLKDGKVMEAVKSKTSITKSKSSRRNNTMPPLHPSSRIFKMQKNQLIVEEYDFTKKESFDNSNIAIVIQRIYRGWRCRLELLKEVCI